MQTLMSGAIHFPVDPFVRLSTVIKIFYQYLRAMSAKKKVTSLIKVWYTFKRFYSFQEPMTNSVLFE